MRFMFVLCVALMCVVLTMAQITADIGGPGGGIGAGDPARSGSLGGSGGPAIGGSQGGIGGPAIGGSQGGIGGPAIGGSQGGVGGPAIGGSLGGPAIGGSQGGAGGPAGFGAPSGTGSPSVKEGSPSAGGSAATLPAQSQPTPFPPTQKSDTPTTMQLTIVTMLVGKYKNLEQYQQDIANNVTGSGKHNLVESIYIPVVITILDPAVVIYHEQRVNNETQPIRQVIYAFNQESPCLVRMSTFDIANASRFSVTPEGLQALENIKPEELANRPECDAYWERVGDDFFTAYISTEQCTFDGPGGTKIRPGGSRNLTCSGMSFNEIWRRVPGDQIVRGTLIPYMLQKIENLYPVPVQVFSADTCFKVPCTNSGSVKPAGPTWSAIRQELNYSKKSDINGV